MRRAAKSSRWSAEHSILEEYRVQPGFDFISIDIEGHEMEMFKGFDLRRWKPRLVLLEDHVVNHEKHNHMVSNGYGLIFRTGLNSWYVQDSEQYGFSIGARFEKLRKYWLGLPFRKMRYSR
ncbi:MAG TPA: FkbM family methyltransferase [Burkholderiales bacterium]|nr:FkbM family methyltransferase [Burkholderiales bacterium]